MRYKLLILALSVIASIDVSGQCLSSSQLTIRTSNSCSYFNNGVLIIKNLKPKTPYHVLVNDRLYAYTANDYGTLSVYSMAAGVYRNIKITDRTSDCPAILIEEEIIVKKWENSVEGPVSVCAGDTLNLRSSSPSTWTINSSIINFNATETSLPVGNKRNFTVVAKALIEGCYERDTINIKVLDLPEVRLLDSSKSYCYHKQNELVELDLRHGELVDVFFNGELIKPTDSNVLHLNVGHEGNDNILSVTAVNEMTCQSTTDIALPINGEAPTDDVEIIWWPGNIFSIKNDNPEMIYRWGWINAKGEHSYVNSQSVSSDGMHYFAGNQSAEVNDLMQHKELSENLLFVEYNYENDECFNRLLFNRESMPVFREHAQNLGSGLSLHTFPNPFVESMSISSGKISGFDNLLLSISDASGRLYYHQTVEITNGFFLDVSTIDYPIGSYFVQLSHKGFTLLSNTLIKH